MRAKLLNRRCPPRIDRVAPRRRWFRLWADTRGGVSYIEYIVIIGFIGLAAIGGFKRLRANTWNTVRAQGITFREIGGAGDIPPVTLAKANVPKMPLPGAGFPSGDGKVHLPIIQPKCFAAGTPVATETGLRPIESIAVGERVWARNEQTGEDALARVVQRFITPDSQVIGVDIPIDVARHEVLRVTENHRFYVPDRGWVPARELDGSRLVSIVPRGPPLAGASAIESWGDRTTVYNLEVEGLHTYFVGEARVLVHNANGQDEECTDADGNAPKAWGPGEAALGKVPSSWGAGSPNKKGVGLRWTDPKNPGNGVRIDQGNPANPQATQQVDHVIVRRNGQVIGRNGQPISGSIADNAVEAHIPLSEWLTWRTWDAP
jgi:hypothetical protein